MAITTAIVRQAALTSTGTQDYTSSGFGTAKGAIFIVTQGVTDGTAANHINLSLGWTDGTRDRCLNKQREDGVTTTDSRRKSASSVILMLNTNGNGTTLAEAAFSAFITDGVRINWTTVDSAFLVTCILLGGSDLSIYAGHAAVPTTASSSTDVTDPGFEPDIVLVATSDGIAIDSANGASWNENSFGVVHNDGGGTITNRGIFDQYQDSVTTTNPSAYYSATYCLGDLNTTGGTTQWEASLTAFDSSGFSITTSGTGGATSTDAIYLALKFANHSSGVITHTTPTSTGNDAETGFGFTPQFVMMGMGFHEAVDTGYENANAGPFGFSAFTASAEFSNTVATEDGASTSNEQSLSDNQAVNLADHDGTTGLTASFVSMDANGFTLNYANVEAAGKLFWAWAVEESGAGPATAVKDLIGGGIIAYPR